ncbi:uncharacterized protein LOC111389162 [Olea europaea var. sylvestris]|uniref:uncharacterized protein LOC111389162 n=1 Tax=Olea europaea var. sylvestris TaxID=158386 RepID=UPI000C1D214E|nr:uncharacterized protein LOC111389162 [Olea europaea var. sylvestris]
MAASIFQKFLRSQSLYATKLISHPSLPPAYLLTQISEPTILADEIPLSGHQKIANSRLYPSISSHFYPSFSFGFFLHPVFSSIGSIRSEPDDETVSESPLTIWADSVKKKRKRKMNRHKLRKLRKSLKNKS